MKGILKYPVTEDDFIILFMEAMYDAELKYSCNDLFIAGIDNEAEIGLAILKSIQAIYQAGLMPEHHFKHRFVTNIATGDTYSDWRISRMGFLLVIMHATGNNPLLNKWKIEMAKLLK
jgi:hypothetical protein